MLNLNYTPTYNIPTNKTKKRNINKQSKEIQTNKKRGSVFDWHLLQKDPPFWDHNQFQCGDKGCTFAVSEFLF